MPSHNTFELSLLQETYERFCSISAFFSVILYASPAAVLVLILNHFNATKSYVVPALLVYLIAALAHMLAWGFQALASQIKISTEYALRHGAIGNQD